MFIIKIESTSYNHKRFYFTMSSFSGQVLIKCVPLVLFIITMNTFLSFNMPMY